MKWTPIIGIICITALLTVALVKGIDGALMASGFAIIGGLGGYEIKILRDRSRRGK